MKTYPTRLDVIHRSSESEWLRIEKERTQKAQEFSLLAKNDKPFWFVMIPEVLSLVSEIAQDRGFLTSLELPESYIKARSEAALKKEAYYSSRIEGAVTSLEAAFRNMDKKSKNFSDESMQMIYNNKLALEFMHQQKGKPFSHEMIKELHRILIYNTHKEKPITVGNYRKGQIYVVNGAGEVVYQGPPPEKAVAMMDPFVTWLNQKSAIHPLVDAAMAHLYFVHVHPFDDGNGRSARALSNLYLVQNGYDFINFLSPSDYFEHHKSAYYEAIQSSRDHGYDATYFILYYLEALKDQLVSVKRDLQKEKKIKRVKNVLKKNIEGKLNKRQAKALRYMMGNEETMTTRKYCKLSQCSDETARKDFTQLLDMGLITEEGSGRSTQYRLKLAP